MNSDHDHPRGWGCPIRRSRDHRSLASPPGFSQRATSFIASQCQGIHQMPLICACFAKTAAHRGKPPGPSPSRGGGEPRSHASRMKTLLSDRSGLAARPIRLGHITTLSSPFNQPKPTAPTGAPSRAAGGGGERVRTDDLLLAKQALSQLSYTPVSGTRSQAPGKTWFLAPGS